MIAKLKTARSAIVCSTTINKLYAVEQRLGKYRKTPKRLRNREVGDCPFQTQLERMPGLVICALVAAIPDRSARSSGLERESLRDISPFSKSMGKASENDAIGSL